MALCWECTCTRRNIRTKEMMIKYECLTLLMIIAHRAAGWTVEVGEMSSTKDKQE